MPCTTEAIHSLENADILYGPGKAANAGGVAVSGLEMSQNSLRYAWTRKEVDDRLKKIMIHHDHHENLRFLLLFSIYNKGSSLRDLPQCCYCEF